MILKACAVNLVTPFTDTNEIDFSVLEKIIDKHLDSGVSAIVLGRSTGEFQTMNDDEIISILDFTLKKVNKKVPVLIQTGFNDMTRSVTLSIRAKMSGADALILSAPYYNKTNSHGLLNHFKSIMMAVAMPCFIENDPDRCGYDIPIDVIVSLSELGNLSGVIESSEDINRFGKLRSSLPANVSIISGLDKMVIPALSLGADGYISVLANIWNKEAVEIFDSFNSGKISKARELFYFMYPIMELMELEPNPIAIKTTMNMLGYEIGEFRLPLAPMDPDKAAKVVNLLMDMSIISV